MKKILITTLAALAVLVTPLLAGDTGIRNPQAPNVTLQGQHNEILKGSILTNLGTFNNAATIQSNGTVVGYPFLVSGSYTITSGTSPVVLLPASAVPAGQSVYLTHAVINVAGATGWSSGQTISIQGTDLNKFIDIPSASLVGNAILFTSNSTFTTYGTLATGGSAAKGLQLISTGTCSAGSVAKVILSGFIK